MPSQLLHFPALLILKQHLCSRMILRDIKLKIYHWMHYWYTQFQLENTLSLLIHIHMIQMLRLIWKRQDKPLYQIANQQRLMWVKRKIKDQLTISYWGRHIWKTQMVVMLDACTRSLMSCLRCFSSEHLMWIKSAVKCLIQRFNILAKGSNSLWSPQESASHIWTILSFQSITSKNHLKKQSSKISVMTTSLK